MDEFAIMPPRDRSDLFRAAAEKRGIGTALMEKDFWVCWTLKRLFAPHGRPTKLLFKGGTSLSKVYHAIRRFSEDIDLAFDRAALGFAGVNDPAVAPSRNQRERKLLALSETCRSAVKNLVLPALTAEIGTVLPDCAAWKLELAGDDQDRLTLAFAYPSALPDVPSYVRPQIRLEFGARSDHWPAVDAEVTPFVAEEYPSAFKAPKTPVRALAAERTFWEKVTALHAWHSHPTGVVTERRSRHYYDVVCLYEGAIGKRALADHKLLEEVTRHKSTFFAASSAHYELAKPGTLALLPPEGQLKRLRQDYDGMAEMVFGPVPSFDHILDVLAQMSRAING
jgi:hypothetical protein